MTLRSSTTAFAKSTRPEIGSVVLREGLFARLDGGAGRTVVWLSAPAGFGKTTLAACWLGARAYRSAWYVIDDDDDDPENFFHYLTHAVRDLRSGTRPLPAFGQAHRDDLAGFARRYFRALFADVVAPAALVIDNLHDLGDDSPLRVVLEAGLPQVPRQCCVVVTSRGAPPVALARMQPAGQLVHVVASELKISLCELDELAKLRGLDSDVDALRALHARADGWAAALVLMIEHRKLAQQHEEAAPDSAPRVVFDYLAGEIFDRFEPAMQRLLLHVSLLPRVTVDVARSLSGDDAAARVLLNLSHNDYFVREHVGAEGRVFVIHPLLREFLLQRAARDLPQAVDAAALHRAALLLRDSGQPEDALTLFLRGHAWADAAAVIEDQAASLLEQGRQATLAAWLEALPPNVVGGSGALLAAQGAAVAHISPRNARRRFEDSFELFSRRGDQAGVQRACLGVIDAILREFDDLSALDRWLAEFDRAVIAARLDAVVPSTVLAARLWRNPTHPSVGNADPASRDGGAGLALVRAAAAVLSGEFARSAAIVAALGRLEGLDVSTRVALIAADALRLVLDGDHDAAMKAARAGLEASALDGLHVHDAWLRMLCVAAALGSDDLDAARAELDTVDAMALRRGDRAFVHHLRSWLARAAGNAGESLREARSAAVLAVEAGLPWLEGLSRIAMAQLLAGSGDAEAGDSQMRAAEQVSERLANPLLHLALVCTRAALMLDRGNEPAVDAGLRAAFARVRELGVHHVPGVPTTLLARLCVEALRRDIAADHVRLLVQSAALAPPAAALRLRRWPWTFEIGTLGSFTLTRGGEPIEFSAKGPGRPVELLKVLVALGGQDVRAEQLADALWPHVDADYAHKSFTATLHRLRRLFGEDDAIRLRDGRLGLNPALFWLDVRALDEVLAEIERSLRETSPSGRGSAIDVLAEEAIGLYRGPFLNDEAEQPAYIARREQLRGRLLRNLGRVARHWEEGGRGDRAVDIYLRCIDADPQCEAFYRNLMLCYQRHGDIADALGTYARLEAVLAAQLKSAPSPETQAIRATLRPA